VILSQSVNDAIARALQSPEDLRELAEADRIAAEDHAYNAAQHEANLERRREALREQIKQQQYTDDHYKPAPWRMKTDPKTGQVVAIDGHEMAVVNSR
jgi:hypothetical protein